MHYHTTELMHYHTTELMHYHTTELMHYQLCNCAAGNDHTVENSNGWRIQMVDVTEHCKL